MEGCIMNRLRGALVLTVCVAALGAGQSPAPQDQTAVREMRRAMLAAEDGRPLTRKEAAPLLTGLSSGIPAIRRTAVRALGRLEDSQFAADIAPLLKDEAPEVRAEAANALGQMTSSQLEPRTEALLERLGVERNEMVRGVLCETLGRLPYAGVPDMQRIEEVLGGAARSAAGPGPLRVGAVKGLDALLRRGWSRTFRAAKATVDLLTGVATGPSGSGSSAQQVQARRMAMLALTAGRVLGEVQVRALGDPDSQVRRLAIVAALADAPFDGRAAMVERALADPDAMVRYEGLRVHGRHLAKASCRAELAALNDASPHVRLLAIDLLGTPDNCRGDASVTPALVALVRALVTPSSGAPGDGRRSAGDRTVRRLAAASPGSSIAPAWQPPAHAIVSLARRAPTEAASLLPRIVAHPVWQVRMYAARAADAIGDAAKLKTLCSDVNPNVREIALPALVRLVDREADAVLIGALGQPSYQVVLQAAGGLKGTPRRAEAVAALLKALDTITVARRETSRDPRLAILDRLQELGDSRQAAALQPFLRDFDPVSGEACGRYPLGLDRNARGSAPPAHCRRAVSHA